jgi:aryl-alcohol dehydrogenase-like predicted oxidoreductase
MEHVELGKSSTKFSIVGLGAWQFGTRAWGFGPQFTKNDATAVIEKAVECGVDFIDTAEIYGNGESERIIGDAIKGLTGDLFIASKVAPWNLTPDRLIKAATRSLERLGISRLTLYQIHFPNPLLPVRGYMRAMEKLIQQGKIDHIGVSNFNARQVKAAQEALLSHEIVSNQVKYNLIDRKVEDKIVPYAQSISQTIIAYSPLAQGLLTGKYHRSNRPQTRIMIRGSRASPWNLDRIGRLVDDLRIIGSKYDKTPSQVALNWLMKRARVAVIPGAKSPAQVEENCGAANWRMSQTEFEYLDRSSKAVKFDRVRSLLWFAARFAGGLGGL